MSLNVQNFAFDLFRLFILFRYRFGKQYKVYDRILPSMFLDVTDIIEDCKTFLNVAVLGQESKFTIIFTFNSQHLVNASFVASLPRTNAANASETTREAWMELSSASLVWTDNTEETSRKNTSGGSLNFLPNSYFTGIFNWPYFPDACSS